MTNLPVPPVCIRPSVEMDAGAGSNEDDITMKLMQIVEVNNILRQVHACATLGRPVGWAGGPDTGGCQEHRSQVEQAMEISACSLWLGPGRRSAAKSGFCQI